MIKIWLLFDEHASRDTNYICFKNRVILCATETFHCLLDPQSPKPGIFSPEY